MGSYASVTLQYFERLLSPPLPGDGLLFVGFVEGLVGWSLSWLFATRPGLAPFGIIESIVLLWVVLTAGIVAVGVGYTAPTVRRNRIWLVWGALNALAIAVNVLGVAGLLPGSLRAYAYWQPWFLALGVGYLATAGYNWTNPQLRRSERVAYAVGGVAALAALYAGLETSLLFGRLFVVGAALHVLPMGFDVGADLALVLRVRSR